DNGFDVVAAVSGAPALARAAVLHRPDIAIVDIRLPPTFRDEGVRAALGLRRRVPETAILAVSQYVEQACASALLANGAGGVGYLLKERVFSVKEFVDAVRRVAAGGTALDPEVVGQLLSRRRAGAASRPSRPRARGARLDGRGPVERRHRRGSR